MNLAVDINGTKGWNLVGGCGFRQQVAGKISIDVSNDSNNMCKPSRHLQLWQRSLDQLPVETVRHYSQEAEANQDLVCVSRDARTRSMTREKNGGVESQRLWFVTDTHI